LAARSQSLAWFTATPNGSRKSSAASIPTLRREVSKVSLMLGVKRDNRESVHGPMKVVFDAKHWVGGILEFAHSGLSKTHTRTRGVSEKQLFLAFS
jgi:hypothetical protein